MRYYTDMFEDNPDKLEELQESLYDLKHDLGKYIRLPLAMLPASASAKEVVAAIVQGVEHTRKGPAGVRSARDIFDAYHLEWGGVLSGVAAYRTLRETLETAISWSRRVAGEKVNFERSDVLRDLTAVGEGVQAVLNEVERGS